MFVEDAQQVIIDGRTNDELLLVPAQNNVLTLALVNASITLRRTIGVADEETLTQLDVAPPPSPNGVRTVHNIHEAGPKLVCFTSGATGQVKGVLRTYESWIQSFHVQHDLLGYSLDSAVLIMGSLAHSMHLYGAMEALHRGQVPTILERFSPRQIFAQCLEQEIQMFYATPTHLSLISDYATKNPIAPLNNVSHIMTGGAKLDEGRLEKLRDVFPCARIVEFFGTTETSYITIKASEGPHGSVGTACPGVSVKICDDSGVRVPDGVEGTLWVKSHMLFEKYIIGEDLNTTWDTDYVTVGDQGYLDTQGNFYFTARKGLMVTVAGENVFIDNVESVLRTCIVDRESAIIAVADDLRGNQLLAVTQEGLNPKIIDETLSLLRRRFGPLKSPRYLLQIENWPYLPSGKVDRQALRQRVAEIE